VVAGFVERTTCPVCDSSDREELYRAPFGEPPIRRVIELAYTDAVDWELLRAADYVLDECRTCTLIYQRFIPDELLSAKVYEEWADPERSLHKRERHVPELMGQYVLEVLSAIEFLGRKPEELRFLDFGMGWGLWLRMARALGVDAAGVEVSESRLIHAQELGLPVIPPERLGENSFDFINTEQVFEHLHEPGGTAEELAATLRPGGILRISVPNALRLKRRLRRRWTPQEFRRRLGEVSPFQHLNAFTHRSLVRLGERVGLHPVRIPLRLRYRYAPLWMPARRVLRRTVGLHYRALRHQDTVLWFRRDAALPE
jgi:SAM-dependent methyltransferase